MPKQQRQVARPCTLILVAAGALFGQHADSLGLAPIGVRFYRSNCSSCHGPDGNSVAGVDLSRGKFRRAASDLDLIRIIRNGIPGSSMSPANLTEFQAREIVAYLHSMSAEAAGDSFPAGDPTRGRILFEGKGACLSCHRIRGSGSRLGPDLSEIGALRRSRELRRSTLTPASEVLPRNRSARVVTRDGVTVTGRLLNQDTFSIQLLSTNEQLVSFMKSDLQEWGLVTRSTMPSYAGRLTSQEVADIVAYLVSLR